MEWCCVGEEVGEVYWVKVFETLVVDFLSRESELE
jgi:hypothetical protein